jgi:hypothetical protein
MIQVPASVTTACSLAMTRCHRARRALLRRCARSAWCRRMSAILTLAGGSSEERGAGKAEPMKFLSDLVRGPRRANSD